LLIIPLSFFFPTHLKVDRALPLKVKNATCLTLLKQRFDLDHISIIKRMT
jgi:hypothetical protein